MSRTDKDRPYHVRALDPLEPGRYVWHEHGIYEDQPCDLADYGRGRTRCGWYLDLYPVSRPPRWLIRDNWTGPRRAAERTWARNVVKGDHEAEPPEGRHRHGVLWWWM